MILEIAVGVALGVLVAVLILSLISDTLRRRHQDAENRAARLAKVEAEALRRDEDRRYWEGRRKDEAERISRAQAVIDSAQVELIATGLRAKARRTVDEEKHRYDENWLVICFYERLICALWGRRYVDYGVESVAELIAKYRSELVRDGILQEVPMTPTGLQLTVSGHGALSRAPALKQSDDWWVDYVERTAKNGIPAEAVSLWRKLCIKILLIPTPQASAENAAG